MIVYLIGTKAQYIKMAPVVLETKRQGLPFKVVLTGQHSETFAELQANFALGCADRVLIDAGEAADHYSFVSWLRQAWRASGRPEMRSFWRNATALVVHGDTASTLLGAMIGRRFSVPVVHVEAGLRSHNIFHPFPEELIRIAVSKIAVLHLCPDEHASNNLHRAKGTKIVTHGNTLWDAQRLALTSAVDQGDEQSPFAVFSLHRHENLFSRERLSLSLNILKQVAQRIPVRFVLHPVTEKRLRKLGELDNVRAFDGVQLLPRMDFFSFSRLIRKSRVVLTDGGSNQEECAMLGIPCVILRRATERPDGLGSSAIISDLDAAKVLEYIESIEDSPSELASARFDGKSPSNLVVVAIRDLAT